MYSYPGSNPTYLPQPKPTLCPSLLLIISISFNFFEIVLFGDNSSAFGLDLGGGGSGSGSGSTLLRDMVVSFIAIWFFDIVLFIFFFILISFRFFDIFLVIAISLRV